jgi:putative PIN family toxin of toxin-antitoxin system
MPEKNALTIVIDTNIWVSFLIGKKLSSLKDAIIHHKVEICFSDELFSEIFNVVRRPKISKYFPEKTVTELFTLINDNIRMVNPDCIITDCRDPKDNFLLALAVSAKADYIITSDEDLLVLNPFREIQIVSPITFESILNI